ETFSANLPLARPGRCQAPLKDLPAERIRSVLEAAAQFRLQRKAARIRNKIDNHGCDETLFQELAAALGYKENKLPFTLLAQRLPLKLLRQQSTDCEALVFGIAGFLQAPDLDIYERSTRKYVRQLWDNWWPHRDGLQRLILPAKLWRLSGTRPLNHPQRRVAALATLAHNWPAFQRSSGKRSSSVASDFFQALDHPFWNSHYTLTAETSPKEMALIGESRITEILANVLFPFRSDRSIIPSAASPRSRHWRTIGRRFNARPAKGVARSRAISFKRSIIHFGIPITHLPPKRPRKRWRSLANRASRKFWPTCFFH